MSCLTTGCCPHHAERPVTHLQLAGGGVKVPSHSSWRRALQPGGLPLVGVAGLACGGTVWAAPRDRSLPTPCDCHGMMWRRGNIMSPLPSTSLPLPCPYCSYYLRVVMTDHICLLLQGGDPHRYFGLKIAVNGLSCQPFCCSYASPTPELSSLKL